MSIFCLFLFLTFSLTFLFITRCFPCNTSSVPKGALRFSNKIDLLPIKKKKIKEIVGKETSLGWDPVKKIVDAPNAWWEKKLQVLCVCLYVYVYIVHKDLFFFDK
jgi:hypothetical protein